MAARSSGLQRQQVLAVEQGFAPGHLIVLKRPARV